MRGRLQRRAALVSAMAALLAGCPSQQAQVEAPARAVSPDCQAFVDHFGPVAGQLLDVRTFAVGEAYLPLLRPSRDNARVDAIAAFLERPAPPAPKKGPTLLTELQEIAREQTVDSRGLLAALARGDLESYRRLSIRYRSSRERLLTLDDTLDAACGAHLVRPRLPFAQALAAFQPHDAAFRKCYETGAARGASHEGRLDVKVSVDARGAVEKVEIDAAKAEAWVDPGTEPFFAQLGYEPSSAPRPTSRGSLHPNVVACVFAEIKTIHFDGVRSGATVRFPVMFKGQTPVASDGD